MTDHTRKREEPEWDATAIAITGAGLAVAVATCWIAMVLPLVISGGGSGLSAVDAVTTAVDLVRGREPSDAYPAAVRDDLPNGIEFWLVVAITVGLVIALTTLAFRRWEPAVARARLGRRPGDPRGARVRTWARPRDVPRGDPDGFSLGKLDGRELRTATEAHVALIAPTRAGKTTRYVIPWLLEHDGPAIVTSTKRDVLDATREQRERLGRVWVFDPFAADTCAWSPLDGCQTWSGSLRQAHWLADASADGDSEIAGYWRGEAAKLLAPLLHAATLGGRGIADVLSWVDGQDFRVASRALLAHGADDAEAQLQSIIGLDPRNRGTTLMSAGSVLAAYRYPEVREGAAAGDLDAASFLAECSPTLYVVAPEAEQRLLEPIVVALLNRVLYQVIAASQRDRRTRVLLDESANIAPLRELDRLSAQGAGRSVNVASVWQSLAQIEHRYGRAADTILSNSAAKLIAGSTADAKTREWVEGMLGESEMAAELRDLQVGRALLVGAGHAPAVVTRAAYFE